MTYGTDKLHAEVAYIAYHFHWSLADILGLEHGRRLRYLQEIVAINERTGKR